MKRAYDSVLFDFDGVLADTEPIHWACWAETLSGLGVGIELSWEIYRANCIGVADRNMLGFLASLAARPDGLKIDPESLRPQYARKKELFRQRIREASPCAAETVALIRSLTDYRLAVVTSSGRAEVEPVLERSGIRERFEAVVFGEDVARHKPSPDPYLLAAERLGAGRPLVVEDSDAGVSSARAAGFDVVRIAAPGDLSRMVGAALGL